MTRIAFCTKAVMVVWLLLFCAKPAGAQQAPASSMLDLSQNNWRICLDTAARWQEDTLFAPPVDIEKVPVNLPTGGWQMLAADPRPLTTTAHLPATVEAYFWGWNGNKFGVAGNYLGVSWFSTKVHIPAAFQNKRVVLKFESVRFRAEIFVNKKLVGYDLVNSTPFDVDISKAMQAGAENEIDIRITDPNGNFDWRDSQNFMWGDYRTQPTLVLGDYRQSLAEGD